MRILFVCLGNICRSPIAEGVMRSYVEQYHLNWEIASAGTESSHIGSAPHRHSQKVCLQHGVDISGQRARKFTKELYDRFDKVYAMSDDVYDKVLEIIGADADSSKLQLFLNELMPGSNASVPDPWYGDEAGYKPVYEMIDKTCREILKRYKDQ